jgi:hypothetical protein
MTTTTSKTEKAHTSALEGEAAKHGIALQQRASKDRPRVCRP